MAKAKRGKIRKSIRMGRGLLTNTFASKEAADAWYRSMFDKKALEKDGVAVPQKDGILFKDYALNEFMAKRKREYGEATWGADEQRLRDYLLPVLGDRPLNRIQTTDVRALLSDLVHGKGLSEATRDRVRALVSAIYNTAINRDDGPLVANNPTFGLSFKGGKRMGAKEPSYLHTTNECARFLRAAGDLSSTHLVVACLGLMAGLRKQEMIPLRWSRWDTVEHSLEISEKYIQRTGKIVAGTKKGEHSIRFVPLGEEIERVLEAHLETTPHSLDDDFILTGAGGRHLEPKEIYNLVRESAALAKVKVTVHGLRHTFGREFNERSGGNIGALKDILGHSNIMTTQIYSKLGKGRLKRFKDIVSYGTLNAPKTDKEGQ